NVVGSSIPTTRELSGAAIAATRLFVDRRESTVNEAGDYLFAVREGAIGEDHIAAELGEVLIGSAEGRRSADEITAFKSLGLAAAGGGGPGRRRARGARGRGRRRRR